MNVFSIISPCPSPWCAFGNNVQLESPNQKVGLVTRRRETGREASEQHLFGSFFSLAHSRSLVLADGPQNKKVTRLKSNLKSNRAAFKWRDAKIGRSAGTNNFVLCSLVGSLKLTCGVVVVAGRLSLGSSSSLSFGAAASKQPRL